MRPSDPVKKQVHGVTIDSCFLPERLTGPCEAGGLGAKLEKNFSSIGGLLIVDVTKVAGQNP